jgi:hypothetical protein
VNKRIIVVRVNAISIGTISKAEIESREACFGNMLNVHECDVDVVTPRD